MKFLFSVLFLAGVSAQAHVEVGTYTGQTSKGKTCSMKIERVWFVNDQKHPLNERVDVVVSGIKAVVGHPPMADFSNGRVGFNHDLFEGVLATSVGANALRIEMTHEEGKEGPTKFHFVQHDWKQKTSSLLVCENLTFQP